MINENFINFEYIPDFMDHDDTFPHEHYHTPAKLASHEYQECMHKKNNEKECKESSLKVYEKNISSEEKYINCMNKAKSGYDKKLCENTFNKDNKYRYTNNLYGAYKTAELQYCMKDEIQKIIKKTCGDCEEKSKKSESSIAEDMYYKTCIRNKENCEKKYDNAKKCIENLKSRQPETEECLQDIKYNSLYGLCYEHKGFNIGEYIGNILSYLISPIRKGKFYIVYFMFIVMTVIFFGGIFFAFLWMLILFMYTVLGNKGKRAFPGMIIFEFINQYYLRIHPTVLLISGVLWAFFFGICILLYYFKKTFGWWPASWVWERIGIFPSISKIVFKWFDRMYGCGFSPNRQSLYCDNNTMWVLMEDWMVEFAQDVLEIDKSEEEIRNASNAFRDLGDDDIKVAFSIKKIAEESKNRAKNKGKEVIKEEVNNIKEEFTLFNNKNNYIEENFVFDRIFDIKELNNMNKKFKNINSAIKEMEIYEKNMYDNLENDSKELKKQGEEVR